MDPGFVGSEYNWESHFTKKVQLFLSFYIILNVKY